MEHLGCNLIIYNVSSLCNCFQLVISDFVHPPDGVTWQMWPRFLLRPFQGPPLHWLASDRLSRKMVVATPYSGSARHWLSCESRASALVKYRHIYLAVFTVQKHVGQTSCFRFLEIAAFPSDKTLVGNVDLSQYVHTYIYVYVIYTEVYTWIKHCVLYYIMYKFRGTMYLQELESSFYYLERGCDFLNPHTLKHI